MIDLQIFRWRGFIYNDVGELVKMVVAEDDGEDGGEDGVGVVSVAMQPLRSHWLHQQCREGFTTNCTIGQSPKCNVLESCEI